MKKIQTEKIEMTHELHNIYRNQNIVKRRKKSEGYEYICTATDADAD